MANNFVQFSERLAVLTEDEADWIVALSELGRVGPEDQAHFDGESSPTTEIGRIALELWGEDLGHVYIQAKNGREDPGAEHHVWFSSDEANDPYDVARVVQVFFRKFRSDGNELFALTWSNSCSKPRLGEFGGGAVIVTKDAIETFTAFEWVEKKRQEHDRRDTPP